MATLSGGVGGGKPKPLVLGRVAAGWVAGKGKERKALPWGSSTDRYVLRSQEPNEKREPKRLYVII